MKTRKSKYLDDPEDDYNSDESSCKSRSSEQLGSIANEDELKEDQGEQGHTAAAAKQHSDDEEDAEEEQSQELLPFLPPPQGEEKNNEANPSHDVIHHRLLATGMTHRNVLNPKTSKFHLVPMTPNGLTPPSVDENNQDSRFDDPLPHSNDWPSSSEEEEEEEGEKNAKKKQARSKNAIIELGASSQESNFNGGVITQKDLSDSEESDDGDKKPAAKKAYKKSDLIELPDSSQETCGELKNLDDCEDSI